MDNITSSSSTNEPKTVTTLSRKEKLAMQRSSENGNNNAVQESLATFRRVRAPERLRKSRRTKTHVKKVVKDLNCACNGVGGGDEDDHDKAEVEEKIMVLQKIVPGGEELGGVDNLFEKTAGYILALQFQVKALKVLASFVEGSEKETMKLGG